MKLHKAIKVFWKYFSWVLVVYWMAMIFWGSSLTSREIKDSFPYADVIFHFCEYLILSALVLDGLRSSLKKVTLSALVWGLVFCFVYALSDEYHQLFVAGRTFSLLDLAMDWLGIMTFGAIVYKLNPQLRKSVPSASAISRPPSA